MAPPPAAVHALTIDLAVLPTVKREGVKRVERMEGVIDLDSIPDVPSPVKVEEERSDEYIEDIPGVRALGLKRNRPIEVCTAPPKLQGNVPRPTKNDNPQHVVPRRLDFSTATTTTTDKAVPSIVKRKGETLSVTDVGRLKRDRKTVDVAGDQVAEGESALVLYERMKEIVAAKKRQYAAQVHQFKEDLAQKAELIQRLQLEIGALKDDSRKLKDSWRKQREDEEGLLKRYSLEVEEAKNSLQEKEALMTISAEEIRDLKKCVAEKEGVIVMFTKHIQDVEEERNSLRDRETSSAGEIQELKASEAETVRCKRETEDLRVLLEEREGELRGKHQRELDDLRTMVSEEKEELIVKYCKEIEDLKSSLSEEKEGLLTRLKRELEDEKTRSSIQKAIIENRHKEKMAAYRSEILSVVLKQTVQNQEAQSSVVQVTEEGTSGAHGNTNRN